MDKSRIEEVVATLPEDVDLEALIDKLNLLRKIEIAEAQIAAGDVVSHEEVKQLTQRPTDDLPYRRARKAL